MTEKNSPTNSDLNMRRLDKDEIIRLERQGCRADAWESVTFAKNADLSKIRNVHFGPDVSVGEGATLQNISGRISNCHVGANAVIDNVYLIEFDKEAACGVGTAVCALDETGSRPVVIYPGLSSQAATLMARIPKWFENNIHPTLHDFLDTRSVRTEIGENAVVRDCGRLVNVSVGAGVKVEGARSLVNGAIINNVLSGRPLAYVGYGVDAENFIIEDGMADCGAILRNCYIGQGAHVEKGFSAHDSLFFTNCSFENGEACALLAGPYSVSMHKGTLMIGCSRFSMPAPAPIRVTTCISSDRFIRALSSEVQKQHQIPIFFGRQESGHSLL